jgi:transcriptional regulator with XRE-family HTH domain
VQTISTPSGDKLFVLSEEEYEDLIDTRDAIDAERRLAAGDTQSFTEDEVNAYIAAPSPLMFWRQWRRVAAPALAEYAGISELRLAELEAGHSVADVHTYARLARRLRTPIESLIRDKSRRIEAEAAE